jgi:sulfate/thiosulfate transport system permease protein
VTTANRRVLPGFRFGLSFTLVYLIVLVIIPLGACLVKASSLTPAQFSAAVWTAQARSAYWVTFSTSLAAAVIDLFLGLLLAWVLVRYEFPGRRIFDSLIDLPFALPTAVAGLIYADLYSLSDFHSGWLGQFLVPLGIHVAHTKLGIVLVLAFVGLPFVVRAIEPVLESLDPELEEAAACLGANRWQTVTRVVLPALYPALSTGFALTLARGVGEYGSVVFISANKPGQTEIAPVLIMSQLDQFRYAEATAIATVLLFISFGLLIAINYLERRSAAHAS